jgi:hypothetical protein
MGAEAEVIVFDVDCVLPVFPSPGNSTSCGGGLADAGVGTAFNGVANPEAAATGVNYNEPNCEQGHATGTFSIGGAAGTFVYNRVGGLAVITLASIDGAGYTNGSGAALALFGPRTAGDAQKIAQGCLGNVQTNVGVSVTGVGEAIDLN